MTGGRPFPPWSVWTGRCISLEIMRNLRQVELCISLMLKSWSPAVAPSCLRATGEGEGVSITHVCVLTTAFILVGNSPSYSLSSCTYVSHLLPLPLLPFSHPLLSFTSLSFSPSPSPRPPPPLPSPSLPSPSPLLPSPIHSLGASIVSEPVYINSLFTHLPFNPLCFLLYHNQRTLVSGWKVRTLVQLLSNQHK